MKIFGKDFFKKEKAITVEVTENNKLYEAIYKWIANGFVLDKDDQKIYVKQGFEGNPDTYAIINNIASKASLVPYKLISIRGEEEEEIKEHEVLEILKRPNHYQNWTEFIYSWEIFRLVTGNSLIYAPRLSFGGNNNGKFTQDGMTLMPTQNTSIVAGQTWTDPIGAYVLDLDAQSLRIEPSEVIHSRMPSMTYDNGKVFMGQSPLKSAITLIFTQNKGYELLAGLYDNPMPPGMLVDENQTQPYSKEVQSKLEETWNRKYGSSGDKKGAPILTGGKKQWISFMTSTIKDLMIIESTQNGARVLANVLNWPSALMNDTSAMTLDNLKVFIKQAYTDRIKPDLQVLYEDISNEILPAYAKAGEVLKLVPDYSIIEELQQDKKTTVEWVSIAVSNGILSRNEAREVIDYEGIELPTMDNLTMPFNLQEIGQEIEPTDEEVNDNLDNIEPYSE